jgi:hypothetical protein
VRGHAAGRVVACGRRAASRQPDGQATEALRNLAGLGGLTALGVVALGARLAWLAPTAFAFVGAAVGPRTEEWLTPLTWPVHPGDTGIAFAAALALTGAVVHARYGAAGLDSCAGQPPR